MKDKDLIKKLAKSALKEKWNKTTTPKNYVFGGCSFCKLANENCKICLLPKYFCEKENGKLKSKTLISKIRETLDFLLNPLRITTGGAYFLAHQNNYHKFKESLFLIRSGLWELKQFGRVRPYMKRTIKKFLRGV